MSVVKCMSCDYTWDLLVGKNDHLCRVIPGKPVGFGVKGMNIIQAVKSGKRRKRKNTPDWEDANGSYIYTIKDILATDWEIEERKIEITENDFDDALREAYAQSATTIGGDLYQELKKRLFGNE